jgi:rod shape determining protein RodA
MTPLFRKLIGMHWILVLNMLLLIAFGVFAIYNASAYKEGPALSMKWRDHITYALIGLPVFFAASLVDYRWVRWGWIPAYLAGLGGLVALEVYGVEVLGNKAWIVVGGQSIQPSQLAILSGILALAAVLGHLPRRFGFFKRDWARVLLACIVAGIPAAVVAKEDLGSGLVWGPVFLGMLIAANVPFRYIVTMVLGVLTVVPLMYFFGLKDYQKARIDTPIYMNTGQIHKVDLQKEGWVPRHLEVAIGSAGLEGKGPLSKKVPEGGSVHRSFFPNEAINDFIFAVIAEEMGFRGALLMLVLMMGFLIQGMVVAFRAREPLGRLLAVGVVAVFYAHTFQNAGMNMNVLPVIGLPIPFISYGGTFLVVALFLSGILQSVWVHRRMRDEKPGKGGERQDEDYRGA